jgi:recombination protein RecA
MTTDKLRAFIDKINKTYDTPMMGIIKDVPNLASQRISSGVFELDLVLGGGWPFNRINIIGGEFSTGKTVLALLALVSMQNTDKNTRVHKSRLSDPTKFTPGTSLFIDMEGAFDPKWATAIGVDLSTNVIVTPASSEQVIDIVNSAIADKIFDLIVIDSIAAMTPGKELESSAEEQQMGLAAKLNNKAFRTWQSSLNSLNGRGPILICLNQLREKMGVTYGDNRILPGGKGQGFAASIVVWNRAAKVEDTKEIASEYVTFGGVTKKNKTFTPQLEFSWGFQLVETPKNKKCKVRNEKNLVDRAIEMEFFKKTASGGYEFKGLPGVDLKEGAWIEKLKDDEKTRITLWRSLINYKCGIIV